MPDITLLLDAAAAGDRKAAADLLPLVYDELRKLAAAKIAVENPGHTLDATALVHEAYLRLTGEQSFQSRSHFMRAAAEAMRRILVDHARARGADKRVGRRQRVPLNEAAYWTESPDHLLALEDSLVRFTLEEPRKAELVVLRFFAGMTIPESAKALDVSVPTAERSRSCQDLLANCNEQHFAQKSNTSTDRHQI
jgi:RNA polymerase sigma factor (TIGR02999 family)